MGVLSTRISKGKICPMLATTLIKSNTTSCRTTWKGSPMVDKAKSTILSAMLQKQWITWTTCEAHYKRPNWTEDLRYINILRVKDRQRDIRLRQTGLLSQKENTALNITWLLLDWWLLENTRILFFCWHRLIKLTIIKTIIKRSDSCKAIITNEN